MGVGEQRDRIRACITVSLSLCLAARTPSASQTPDPPSLARQAHTSHPTLTSTIQCPIQPAFHRPCMSFVCNIHALHESRMNRARHKDDGLFIFSRLYFVSSRQSITICSDSTGRNLYPYSEEPPGLRRLRRFVAPASSRLIAWLEQSCPYSMEHRFGKTLAQIACVQ